MKFLNGSDLSKAIQDLLVGRPADIAVAFWGDGACERLGIPQDATGTRVVCDARSGACNPSAISELLNRKVHIVDVPGLHAKVYIGQEGLIVSSANASANGLGEENKEVFIGREAGYLTQRPEDMLAARQWFETVYELGKVITMADLPVLDKLWLERRKHRPVRTEKDSLLNIMRTNLPILSDRGLKVAIYKYNDPPALVEDQYKLSPFYSEADYERHDEYPFYWDVNDWNVQVGDLILDFGSEDGKIASDGVWRVQAIIDGGALVPVERVQRPLGFELSRSDKQSLTKLVQSLVQNGSLRVDGPLISISDFAQALSE